MTLLTLLGWFAAALFGVAVLFCTVAWVVVLVGVFVMSAGGHELEDEEGDC